MENRAAFLSSGGKAYDYIPCLNEDTDWIAALGGIALKHMAGWPTERSA
jgi:ferrochelatase